MNTTLNYLEKRQRRPWWWLAEDIDDMIRHQQLESELFYTIGKDLEREELGERIRATLNSMNQQSQEILKLRFFEELDYKAIAKRLRIRLSAARMRLKRAREEFKHQYEKLTEQSEHVKS